MGALGRITGFRRSAGSHPIRAAPPTAGSAPGALHPVRIPRNALLSCAPWD